MKRILKSRIFVFVLGMIVMAGIVGVYAINANEITYNNTTVDQALDTLYQRSNYTEYSGETTITPSTTLQTLSTNDKLLKSDITINAIPSNYKNLSSLQNELTASDLLLGKRAYNSNGEVIEGTYSNEFTCNNCMSYDYSGGPSYTRTATLSNLSSGKYLIFASTSTSMTSGSQINEYNNYSASTLSVDNNNCTLIYESPYSANTGTTNTYVGYLGINARDAIWSCELASTTTIVVTNTINNNTGHGNSLKAYSVKIN